MAGIIVTGMLVEVEKGKEWTNERTGEIITPYYAYVFASGRQADRFEVGRDVDVDELHGLVGRTIVGDVKIVTKWRGEGRARQPRTDVYLVTVDEHPKLTAVDTEADVAA